jgi:hypothetical protein
MYNLNSIDFPSVSISINPDKIRKVLKHKKENKNQVENKKTT